MTVKILSMRRAANGYVGAEAPESDRCSTVLAGCRTSLGVAVGFSIIINLMALAVPVYTMQVYDRVMISGSLATLAYLTLITLTALLFVGWLEILRGRILQRIGTWLEQRLAAECLRRALAAPIGADPYGTQALRDVAQIRQTLGGTVTTALMDVPWVPIYLAALWLLHPLLASVALGGAAALFSLALMNELLTRRPLATSMEHATAALRLAETASHSRETADTMGMSAALVGRWAVRNDEALRLQMAAGDRAGVLLAASRTCRMAVQVLLLGTGAYLSIHQDISGGSIMASTILMARALAPVEQTIGSWRSMVIARTAARRLAAHLAFPKTRLQGMSLPAPQGHLSVERVTVASVPTNRPILKAVSFELPPGESMAIIGPSGAGKSTLVRLLIGAMPAHSGGVRLDGADVFIWDRSDFGRHVGYLPQEAELFDGTIAENIGRMGDPRFEDVVEAARLAGIHEMVLRLPDGYATRVAADGLPLSGGQRQRIALARALFGNPRLVVLDEPNSNLDGDGEAALISALTMLKERGVTVVAVTHRPSLLRVVDRVLVLREGAVESFGPRDQVLARLTRPYTAVHAAS